MSIETRLRNTGQPQGGGGGSSNSGGLAGTGGLFAVYSASPLLPQSRIITAGSSITVVTDATSIYISALTGAGAAGSAGLMGTGNYLIVGSAQPGLPGSRILTPGSSVTMVTDATAFYITAITNTFAGSGGLVGSGGLFAVYSASPLLPNSRIITAGSSISLRTDTTALYIDALTGGAAGASAGLAGTGPFYLLHTSGNSTLPLSKILSAGNNISLTTDAVAMFITATTGVAPGTGGLMGTGGFFVGWSSDTTMSNEKVLTAGSSVTLVTDASAIYISAITSPAGSASAVGGAGAIQYASNNALQGDSSNLYWDFLNKRLGVNINNPTSPLQVGTGSSFPFSNISSFSNTASYSQINHQNLSASNSASTDYIATANNGTDTSFYVDLGINSSTYNNPAYSITSAGDSYLYAANQSLTIGLAENASANAIKFHVGGTQIANEKMRIDNSGKVGIGITAPTLQLHVIGTTQTDQFAVTSYGTGLVYSSSGGSNLVSTLAARSANTFLGINSNSVTPEFKTIVAGSNVTLTFVKTGIQIDAATGGASNVNIGTGGFLQLPVQSAKLYASTSAARIDAGTPVWRLLYSATTQQYGIWQFTLPFDYSGSPATQLIFSSDSSLSVAKSVQWLVDEWGFTNSQENVYIDTFAGANSTTIALSAGYSAGLAQIITVPLATTTSFGAGNLIRLRVSASAGAVTGNQELIGLGLFYRAGTQTIATGSAGLQGTGSLDIVYASDTISQPNSKVFTAGTNVAIRTTATAFIIDAPANGYEYWYSARTNQIVVGGAGRRMYLGSQVNGTALGATVIGINSACFVPFVPTKDLKIDTMGCVATIAGSATSLIQLGIFTNSADAVLYPFQSVATSGVNISGTNTTLVGFNPACTLSANQLYWFAYMINKSAVTLRTLAVGGAYPIYGMGTDLGTTPGLYLQIGVNPSNGFANNYSGTTANIISTAVPALAVRVSI